MIHDHATIGFVVTTDGSVTDLPRENYVAAEERTVKELRQIGKPFLILLNCQKPYSKETERLRSALEEKYAAPVYPVNCEQLKEDDIYEMMRQVLYEFPVTEIEFYIPKWVEMLSRDHRIKKDLIENVKKIMAQMSDLRSVSGKDWKTESPYIDQILLDQVEMDTRQGYIADFFLPEVLL